jgi:hypothetical protein
MDHALEFAEIVLDLETSLTFDAALAMRLFGRVV